MRCLARDLCARRLKGNRLVSVLPTTIPNNQNKRSVKRRRRATGRMPAWHDAIESAVFGWKGGSHFVVRQDYEGATAGPTRRWWPGTSGWRRRRWSPRTTWTPLYCRSIVHRFKGVPYTWRNLLLRTTRKDMSAAAPRGMNGPGDRRKQKGKMIDSGRCD